MNLENSENYNRHLKFKIRNTLKKHNIFRDCYLSIYNNNCFLVKHVITLKSTLTWKKTFN